MATINKYIQIIFIYTMDEALCYAGAAEDLGTMILLLDRISGNRV